MDALEVKTGALGNQSILAVSTSTRFIRVLQGSIFVCKPQVLAESADKKDLPMQDVKLSLAREIAQGSKTLIEQAGLVILLQLSTLNLHGKHSHPQTTGIRLVASRAHMYVPAEGFAGRVNVEVERNSGSVG